MTDSTTSEKCWLFEVKVVRAIRTEKFGEPFDAEVFLNVVNGQLHIEGLLSKEDLKRDDLLEVEQEIKRRGFDHYYYSRFKHGQRRLIKKRIK
jgi:hypothetical protein